MKKFTDTDVQPHAGHGAVYADPAADLVHDPLPWQAAGLSETASGYGARLTSQYKIHFNGRFHRLRVTQYANAGSTWFVTHGRKIFVI